MKKFISIMLVFLLLSACSSKKQEMPALKVENILPKLSEMKEIPYEQDLEGSVEFFGFTVNMSGTLKIDAKGRKQSLIQTELFGQKFDVEVYVVDGYVYTHSPIVDVWVKNKIQDTTSDDQDKSKQMFAILAQLKDNLSFDATDKHYKISVRNLSQKQLEDLIKLIKQGNMIDEQLKDLDLKLKDLQLTVLINKETQLYDEIEMHMEFTFQEQVVKQDIKIKSKNWNKVEEITLPQEAMNAQLLDETN